MRRPETEVGPGRSGVYRRLPTIGRVAGLLLCAILGLVAPASSQEMPVPVPLQASLLLRVVTFDRAFEPKSAGTLVVGIVYQENFRDSYLAMRAFSDAVAAEGATPGGESIRVVALPLTSTFNLRAATSREGIDFLYVAPLRATNLNSVLVVSREAGLLTTTGVPESVERGVAVGIGSRNDKPVILINMEAAESEGADFSSELLKLAYIVAQTNP